MGRLKRTSPVVDVIGKVGPIVISNWKNLTIVKTLPTRKRSTKQSAKQVQENTAFSIVMQLLLAVTRAINIGFQMPRNAKMTPLNKAISYYMMHAIVGGENESYLDLAQIKFSRPIRSTQCAWNAALSAEEGRVIKVTWELNPFPMKCTQLNDWTVFIFYDSHLNLFYEVLQADTKRENLTYTIVAPKSCVDHEWYAYMFLVSADGKLVSETEYLGIVNVLA